MSHQSLMDRAMRLTVALEKLKERQDVLREKAGQWTSAALAGGDVANMAHSSLESLLFMADRLNRIVDESIEAIEGKE